MLEVKREKTKDGNIIKGITKCIVCGKTFQMIENKNATFIVDSINSAYGRDESINFEVIAKCNNCGYTSKYFAKLNL